jgi:hypothetical protein
MRTDVTEAAEKYGYEISYRRRKSSTPDGTLPDPKAPYTKNEYVDKTFVVKVVHLVWKSSDDLLPMPAEDYIDEINDAGQRIGNEQREGSKVKIKFELKSI